jgi:hypothetical protein
MCAVQTTRFRYRAKRHGAQHLTPPTPQPIRRPKPHGSGASYAFDGTSYLGSIVEADGFHFAFDPGIGRFRTRLAAWLAFPGARESAEAALCVGSHPFITSEVLQ